MKYTEKQVIANLLWWVIHMNEQNKEAGDLPVLDLPPLNGDQLRAALYQSFTWVSDPYTMVEMDLGIEPTLDWQSTIDRINALDWSKAPAILAEISP